MDFDIPKIDRVEIHAAKPEAADMRRLAKLAEDRKSEIAPVTWVFKLYVQTLPAPRGGLLELLVGDTLIRRYSEFPGGLYFTVNDISLAQALVGQAIRFRPEGETQAHDTGVRMPTTMGQQRGGLDADLPRQLDLLRK